MLQDEFLAVNVDHDAERFSIRGPMTDDRVWITRAFHAQRQRPYARCFSVAAERWSDDIAAEHSR